MRRERRVHSSIEDMKEFVEKVNRVAKLINEPKPKFFWTTSEALEALLSNLELVRVGYPKFHSWYKYNAKSHTLTWMYHGDGQLFKEDHKQYSKEEQQAMQVLIDIGRKDIEEGRFYTEYEMTEQLEELSKNNPYKS